MDDVMFQEAHAAGTLVLSCNRAGEWEVDCGPCDTVVHTGKDEADARDALDNHLREVH